MRSTFGFSFAVSHCVARKVVKREKSPYEPAFMTTDRPVAQTYKDKRTVALLQWREVLGEYLEFNAFLSYIFSPFLIDPRT